MGRYLGVLKKYYFAMQNSCCNAPNPMLSLCIIILPWPKRRRRNADGAADDVKSSAGLTMEGGGTGAVYQAPHVKDKS
jgi:hypothetical protein